MCNNRISIDKNCNLIVNDNTFNCNYVQVFLLQNYDNTLNQIITRTSRLQKIIFSTDLDGFYTICKVTIPVDESMPYYYKNGKYYNNITEISLLDILDTDQSKSKISIEYLHYFSTCNLKKCYIKICKDIFKLSSTICNHNNIDNNLSYKRDLIWSALNVIQYLTEMEQYDEALRLLLEIIGCNGLCPSIDENNCGCNK